jgi:hypothetical protein
MMSMGGMMSMGSHGYDDDDDEDCVYVYDSTTGSYGYVCDCVLAYDSDKGQYQYICTSDGGKGNSGSKGKGSNKGMSSSKGKGDYVYYYDSGKGGMMGSMMGTMGKGKGGYHF